LYVIIHTSSSNQTKVQPGVDPARWCYSSYKLLLLLVSVGVVSSIHIALIVFYNFPE